MDMQIVAYVLIGIFLGIIMGQFVSVNLRKRAK